MGFSGAVFPKEIISARNRATIPAPASAPLIFFLFFLFLLPGLFMKFPCFFDKSRFVPAAKSETNLFFTSLCPSK
ncbi:hypothetical protein EAI88_07230 [Eubacterium ramulus]|nr:hypothetical protein EAI88_07230 [Eubacterium ramulus]